jgi:hypothetical protein
LYKKEGMIRMFEKIKKLIGFIGFSFISLIVGYKVYMEMAQERGFPLSLLLFTMISFMVLILLGGI